MGYEYSKSFTEDGIKYLNKYFIVNILNIFLVYILTLITYGVYFSFYTGNISSLTLGFTMYVVYVTIIFLFALISVLIAFSGTIRYSLIGVLLILYVFCFVPFFAGFCLLGLQFFTILIIIFLLIFGIIYLLCGSKEFGKKHQLFVIVAFCLAIIYFVLFIINLILSGIMANMVVSLYFFLSIELFSQIFSTVILLSIFLTVLANLAFVLFVYNLTKKKVVLWIAFILGILAPFTFSLMGIISLLMFFICYRDTQGNLEVETVKPRLQVPCPFCNREIPMESNSCRHCGKVFNVNSEYNKFNF